MVEPEKTIVIEKEKIADCPTLGVDPSLLHKITPSKNINGILRISDILKHPEKYIDKSGTIAGWARTVRKQADIFVELSDGSCFGSIQVVIGAKIPNYEDITKTTIGTAFRITGNFVKSPAKGQVIEMQAFDPATAHVKIVGSCPSVDYPLQKKGINPETLRELAHLRPRTNIIGAVARVRNNLAFATHLFFQSRGFQYIHTPCITTSDCEGAGEMFQVTTLLKDPKKPYDPNLDFFKKPAFLTVSGQLNVETYCSALTNVYTFGPTFRAEDSHTTRHLAEFWMIEPELAFSDLEDNMECAEAYLKFCIKYVLENNRDDLDFFNERVVKVKDKQKDLVKYLEEISAKRFARLTYTEGVDILEKAVAGGHKFDVVPKWGIDLGSEHERYLAEVIVKGPLILYNYPKDIKAFYMKLNDDGKTVQAMDILLPQIGEIVGGSAREDRYEVLCEKIKSCGLDLKPYWWYLDLRKFGSHPHCGFGLGFERLIMLCTGVDNIRETIPFPRYPGHAEF